MNIENESYLSLHVRQCLVLDLDLEKAIIFIEYIYIYIYTYICIYWVALMNQAGIFKFISLKQPKH